MRRVLFVDHVNRILGGAEINLLELLEEAAKHRSWTAACACPADSRLAGALAVLGVPCQDYGLAPALNELRVAGRALSWLAAWRGQVALRHARRRLEVICAEFRPDVVISCTNKDHFAAAAACAATGAASVWWVNDIISPDFFSGPVRWMFRRVARRRARRLVVVSDYARAALLREGLPGSLVRRIHNGIPVARYQGGARGYLRSLAGAAGDEPLIGLVGRFTPWKGQQFFLELARAWSEKNPRGRFLLIGQAFNEEQAFEAGLREFVTAQQLGERVSFVPFQSDLARVFGGLDLLVHASLRPEPFGRVIIEAMAAGVPVLAARAGGVPEIITDGVNGWLAAPGSLPEYLQALADALGSRDRREALSRAGLETVAQRFTIARVLREFEELVENP